MEKVTFDVEKFEDMIHKGFAENEKADAFDGFAVILPKNADENGQISVLSSVSASPATLIAGIMYMIERSTSMSATDFSTMLYGAAHNKTVRKGLLNFMHSGDDDRSESEDADIAWEELRKKLHDCNVRVASDPDKDPDRKKDDSDKGSDADKMIGFAIASAIIGTLIGASCGSQEKAEIKGGNGDDDIESLIKSIIND